MTDQWTRPPAAFYFALFHKTDPTANQCKFYYIAYQPNLWAENTVLRIYGRRCQSQRSLITPVADLPAAWPLIRRQIRRRLRRGYVLVSWG